MSAPPPPGPHRINYEPISRFLCQFFNVQDVCQINPFGSCQHGWRLAQECVLTVEASGHFSCEQGKEGEEQTVSIPVSQCKWVGTGQPRPPFCHPKTGEPMPVNLDDVCIYDMKSRYNSSTHDIPWAVRLNYEHVYMSQLQQTTELDEMFKEAGAVSRAYMAIFKNEQGEEMEMAVPIRNLEFSVLNPSFVRTTMLLNERNIMNGIIRLPREVCEQAKLPIYKGPPEPSEEMVLAQLQAMEIEGEEEDMTARKQQVAQEYIEQYKRDWEQTYLNPKLQPIDHYVAIPINHLLAWGLQSQDYADERNYRAERFHYKPAEGEPVVLYFLLANAWFDTLLKDTLQMCLGKVDRRPLGQVGFEFVPMTRPSQPPGHYEGDVTLRTVITYAAAPTLSQQTIDGLAMTLHPEFPTSHFWSVDEMTRQLNIDHQLKVARDKKIAARKMKKMGV